MISVWIVLASTPLTTYGLLIYEQVDYSLDEDWLRWGKLGVQKWMLSTAGAAVVATGEEPQHVRLDSQPSSWEDVPPVSTNRLLPNVALPNDRVWNGEMDNVWDQEGPEELTNFSWDMPFLALPEQGACQVSNHCRI